MGILHSKRDITLVDNSSLSENILDGIFKAYQESKTIQHYIERGTWFGCVYRDISNLTKFLTLDPTDIAFVINSLSRTSDKIIGDIDILDTFWGKLLYDNIENCRFIPRYLSPRRKIVLVTFDFMLN